MQLWSFLTRTSDWLQLLLINSIIATLLTLVTPSTFLVNLIYSQCIGISIAGMLVLITRLKKLPEPTVWIYLPGIPLGAMTGIITAFFLSNDLKSINYSTGSEVVIRSLLFSVLIGSVVTLYFVLNDKRQKARAALAEERLRLADKEKQLVESHLMLLQAQIEPHFLFNTLSNVVGLIEARPDAARQMLESLTIYLRATLHRTREETATVSDEAELLQAYLSIQKIRMDKRLEFSIDVQPGCEKLNLPPLLIQPLVENAIIHGLEPAIEGGEVTVSFSKANEMLKCVVSDTGMGLDNEKQPEKKSIGLINIRQRLTSLYPKQAELILRQNKTTGMTASLTIALECLS
ncbi:MAG: histidine kinase [Gammaproteobacteria bacterium]|jgi:sensor histidine kinase YesM|nr:histidine kinase [Gammaproteobacteria bacterium]MBT3725269.1 histidine kinase [Gammaproteobacteria bacterium]MBT4076770.1 histidine kinase [Gammaproteobacteria bacterium]MBT4195315.1 histidine kinase [Gammaproteobacteria bacterium]MBT4449618.1 histidine kinase [Gammaproteobacteria bacterium]